MSAVSFQHVSKTFDSGGRTVRALQDVSFDIEEGEFFGLLGPNGAGKTTLISILAGLSRASAGRVTVQGHDVVSDYAASRRALGVVPQELVFDPFFSVRETLRNQSAYFGLRRNDDWIDELLAHLGLSDKAEANMRQLSGGMKRRVLVAQALVHRPPVIVLDEPTAGVDVELRRDMWKLIGELRQTGVTIILTTHYIEEAEEMADRVGVINHGQLMLVEDKTALMEKLGKKTLSIMLAEPIEALPPELAEWDVALKAQGQEIEYLFDTRAERTGVSSLLRKLGDLGIGYKDLNTRQSSLEDIFVSLVHQEKAA